MFAVMEGNSPLDGVVKTEYGVNLDRNSETNKDLPTHSRNHRIHGI